MRNAEKGTYNDEYTYCPMNCWDKEDCPYANHGICHIEDPMEDCDDWGSVWESWDEWLDADDVDPDAPESFAEDEIRWAGDVYGYEDEMEENEE